VHLYDFVYPGPPPRIPQWVRRALRPAESEIDEVGDPAICQGTLISRFSYNIDVNEWGFRDLRKEATIATRQLPIMPRSRPATSGTREGGLTTMTDGRSLRIAAVGDVHFDGSRTARCVTSSPTSTATPTYSRCAAT
jgi:hypothetical protein